MRIHYKTPGPYTLSAHAAFARMSDKTMREIRDRSDRILAEREAAAERAARRIERWAEVVFVTLLAIGFAIWAGNVRGIG